MEFRLQLDVYNPAEYYAALGLLELATRDDDEAFARFDTAGTTGATSTFVLENVARLPDLRAISIRALDHPNPLIAPIMLDDTIELNWWLNDYRTEKSNLKLWAGTSRPVDMLRRYQEEAGAIDENVLRRFIKTKTGKSSFGFDTRASRDALAIGYSQKEAGDASILYPATEFLCAVGLQNFRPFRVRDGSDRNRWCLLYFVWRRPVPMSIAHGAAVQEIRSLNQDAYKISIEFVGQGLQAVDKVTQVYGNAGESTMV
jgi:CRISPR-associated protein Csb3